MTDTNNCNPDKHIWMYEQGKGQKKYRMCFHCGLKQHQGYVDYITEEKE
jgi:hypothetical protein